MEWRVRQQRLIYALSFMVLGSVVVLGMLVAINRFSQGPQDRAGDASNQIAFERKEPPKQNQTVEPKPKPRPRRTPRTPPTPLTGLNTALSGIDLGIPAFSADDLTALDGDLLGGADGVVMTDDTVDQAPRAVFQSPMVYPPRAKAKGVKGYVVLSLLIGITGEIEQIRVVEAYPEGVFEDTAVQGVNQWRFEPAQYEGKAVRAWAKQRVRFDLS